MGAEPDTTTNATSTSLYFGPWYRKSPFFDATLRWGCKAYDIYNHMYLPAYYDELAAEYWALVNDVTLWVRTPSGCAWLTATRTCTRWAWPRAWA